MRVLVLGAADMLVRKLVAALIERGDLRGEPIESRTLADIIELDRPDFAG